MTKLERLNEVVAGARKHGATVTVLNIEDVEALLNVAEAGQRVVDNWASNRLAQEVNHLDWALKEV